jgi:hypothetical protein
MPSKQRVISLAQKFIYGWLIFCIGGVGPLTYFDGLLPGHEHKQHPFHFSVFESVDHHHHNPLPPLPTPEILAQQARLWLIRRFMPETDVLVAHQLTSGLAYFFSSGLSDGYLLTAGQASLFYDNFHFGSATPYVLAGRSALLPPFEKPPQLLFI